MTSFRTNLLAIAAVATLGGFLSLTSTASAQKVVNPGRPVNYRVLPSAKYLPIRPAPFVPQTLPYYVPSYYTPLYPQAYVPAPVRVYSVYSRASAYDVWQFQGSYPSYAAALQLATNLEYGFGLEVAVR